MSYNSLSSIPSSLCMGLSVWAKPKNECPKSCRTLTLANCVVLVLISPFLDSSQPLSTRLLLVLEVPLSCAVATVMAAVILCITSREFLQKQRQASFSQTCYFCHEIVLNWDVLLSPLLTTSPHPGWEIHIQYYILWKDGAKNLHYHWILLQSSDEVQRGRKESQGFLLQLRKNLSFFLFEELYF